MPELRREYQREAASWTDEPMGPYNLFDIIVMPYLVSLLDAGGHEPELKRIFDFIETLAGDPDQDVRDLVGVAVCEDLVGHEVALQRAVKFMGARTKAICDASR